MSEIENLKIYGGATYTVGNENIIANEWEAGVTYVKGKSYVIREHKLYVCNVTHTSVEPFDVTKWTEITIGDAIANNTTAIGDLSTLTTTDKSSLVGAVNSLVGWVDATSEFTKTSNFDTTQNSYFLYNDALKMYAVSFAVKANTPDNGVILSSVPKLKNDIIVLTTGFANAGGLSVAQANVIYYKANDNIVLRISTTTNVPVFVTAFLLKA